MKLSNKQKAWLHIGIPISVPLAFFLVVAPIVTIAFAFVFVASWSICKGIDMLTFGGD